MHRKCYLKCSLVSLNVLQANKSKDGKSITSGESTDTEKDAKDEQTPPPCKFFFLSHLSI